MINTEIKVKKYISEELIKYLTNSKGKNVLVQAPMGSGKTYSFKAIGEYYKCGLVIVSPKRTLLNQIATREGYTAVCDGASYTYSNRPVVVTPDSFHKVFNAYKEAGKQFILIYDEVHSAFLNAEFRPKLRNPFYYLKSDVIVKFLGFSATTEPVNGTYFEEQIKFEVEEQKSFTKQIKFIAPMDIESRIDSILKEIIISTKENTHTILRFNDLKSLGLLQSKLDEVLGKGSTVVFSSDNFTNDETLQDYIEGYKITEKVILTTSVADEGVELFLQDKSSVSTIINYDQNSNYIDIIQFMGRFREGTNEIKIILPSKYEKGAKFEDMYNKLMTTVPSLVEMSELNGENLSPKLIRKTDEGYEAKMEVIEEICIKAELKYQTNTIDKLMKAFKEHYLLKGINCTFGMLSNAGASIKEEIKEEKERIKAEKEEEVKIVCDFARNELPNLHEGHKKAFLDKLAGSLEKHDWQLNPIRDKYELFWGDSLKDIRKLLYTELEKKDIHEMKYDKEIFDVVFNEESRAKLLIHNEINAIRVLREEDNDQLVKDFKKHKIAFKGERAKKIAILGRYFYKEESKKQGRINPRFEEFKLFLKEHGEITKRQITQKKNDQYLMIILNELFEFGSRNRITSIKSTFY